MESAKYCANENTRTERITNQLENEKTVHIGAIKEDFDPCDVFMFMGDEVGISYQLCNTVHDWEGYKRYEGQ